MGQIAKFKRKRANKLSTTFFRAKEIIHFNDEESRCVSFLYEQFSNKCTNLLELHCRPSIKIPVSVMMPVAHVVEWTYKKFAKYGMKVPQLTPSRIRLLSCNRTFSCSRAKDQLGYEPIVPLKVFIYIL